MVNSGIHHMNVMRNGEIYENGLRAEGAYLENDGRLILNAFSGYPKYIPE